MLPSESLRAAISSWLTSRTSIREKLPAEALTVDPTMTWPTMGHFIYLLTYFSKHFLLRVSQMGRQSLLDKYVRRSIWCQSSCYQPELSVVNTRP